MKATSAAMVVVQLQVVMSDEFFVLFALSSLLFAFWRLRVVLHV